MHWKVGGMQCLEGLDHIWQIPDPQAVVTLPIAGSEIDEGANFGRKLSR